MTMRGIARKAVTIAALAALLAPAAGSALAGESSAGGTFLPMGWDARGAGLGGAAAIMIRDDRSTYWNPANLTFLGAPHISLGTTKPIPDMNIRYSILSVGTGLLDTVTTKEDGFVLKRLGVGISISHLGLELAGGSKWSESTAGFSAAVAVNNYNSIGVTFRLLRSWTELDEANASGYALDYGWTARILEKFWLAFVGRNAASNVSYPTRDQSIDPEWVLAAAYENILDIVSTEADVVIKNGEFNSFRFGAEVNAWRDILFVTAGADMRLTEGERTILHFGFGSIYRSAEIALGFIFDPEDAFGRQTRVSIGYSL